MTNQLPQDPTSLDQLAPSNMSSVGGGVPQKRSTTKIVVMSVLITCAVIALCWFVWVTYLFPSKFDPVTLSESETQSLNQKLGVVNLQALQVTQPSGTLAPEPYRESADARRVSFSEREVNALLAHNTDLADKLAIDFSPNLASAVLLLPLDPEFPVLGGQTLKLSAGLELAFNQGRPVVKLRGISLWGVPLPDAWLGYKKNIDLVSEFGTQGGFWSAFADGIKNLSVGQGEIIVELNE